MVLSDNFWDNSLNPLVHHVASFSPWNGNTLWVYRTVYHGIPHGIRPQERDTPRQARLIKLLSGSGGITSDGPPPALNVRTAAGNLTQSNPVDSNKKVSERGAEWRLKSGWGLVDVAIPVWSIDLIWYYCIWYDSIYCCLYNQIVRIMNTAN